MIRAFALALAMLVLGACQSTTPPVPLPPPPPPPPPPQSLVWVDYDYFTVGQRFQDYPVLMIYGATNTSGYDLTYVSVVADCIEVGYPDLNTRHFGYVNLTPGGRGDVALMYLDGFHYYTTNTIWCVFTADGGVGPYDVRFRSR